jgi:hypothetical protein
MNMVSPLPGWRPRPQLQVLRDRRAALVEVRGQFADAALTGTQLAHHLAACRIGNCAEHEILTFAFGSHMVALTVTIDFETVQASNRRNREVP